MTNNLVALDAGHGGKDSGAVGNGLLEKERALKLTLMMDEELRANGVSTLLIRNSDFFVELSARADKADAHGAKVFISNHLNSGGGTGYETFVYNRNDASTNRLQDLVHAEGMKVLKPLGFKDRGIKTANYAVLRETGMPAVLTENGFIDNATDMTHIRKDEVLRLLAKAYTKAICAYLGVNYSGGTSGGGTVGGGTVTPPVDNGDAGTQGLGIAYITGTGVNLRKTPSTSGEIIRQLNKPDSYVVWAEQDGWLNLGNSWVKNDSSFLRFARRQLSNVGRLVVVTTPELWVYSAPDWNAKEKIVKQGDAFTILEELTVNGSKMYKCAYFYITANPEFVTVK
ncbi:N-acetylmuramoyl-L-alanine amidase [Bacillus gaemokensis]|uniref:N-acetylmuramoyl-L-alanine amidase n=1 Tax=Bacillus gaemokensis TaxID=574375 RepID=UPI00068D4ADE|nr:N-acetylmuramoyl-L-alanine amidase [Bacillus gaemokensis]KYG38053.1 hypothetical protein AZF08_20040 [Bacillus gaemokensis]